MTGKSPAKPEQVAEDKQVVFLVGASHGAEHGDKRVVSAEQAKSLVDRGLARYPANHGE